MACSLAQGPETRRRRLWRTNLHRQTFGTLHDASNSSRAWSASNSDPLHSKWNHWVAIALFLAILRPTQTQRTTDQGFSTCIRVTTAQKSPCRRVPNSASKDYNTLPSARRLIRVVVRPVGRSWLGHPTDHGPRQPERQRIAGPPHFGS